LSSQNNTNHNNTNNNNENNNVDNRERVSQLVELLRILFATSTAFILSPPPNFKKLSLSAKLYLAAFTVVYFIGIWPRAHSNGILFVLFGYAIGLWLQLKCTVFLFPSPQRNNNNNGSGGLG